MCPPMCKSCFFIYMYKEEMDMIFESIAIATDSLLSTTLRKLDFQQLTNLRWLQSPPPPFGKISHIFFNLFIIIISIKPPFTCKNSSASGGFAPWTPTRALQWAYWELQSSPPDPMPSTPPVRKFLDPPLKTYSKINLKQQSRKKWYKQKNLSSFIPFFFLLLLG